MQIFLMGHRGTGKTALVQRLQIYGLGKLQVFDLDREIQKRQNQTIEQIFQEKGEEFFRELEKQTLTHLIENYPQMVVALGAGFPLASFVFPVQCELVWVRRASDSTSRIFSDRPRLNQDQTRQEEYRSRFAEREKMYQRNFDWVYTLPEGLEAPCEFEKMIWGNRLEKIGGLLTLREDHFRNPEIFRKRLRHTGVDFFELRTDLLTSREIELMKAWIPNEKKWVSIRNKSLSEEWLKQVGQAAEVDWALELGAEVPDFATCVSLHGPLDSRDTIFEQVQALEKYEKQSLHLKWSPLIESFEMLEFGIRWQATNPTQRSFLPRSQEGRWAWARLYLKGRQKINFFRDGEGSAGDQPTLHEWIRTTDSCRQFGAVLGDPVEHSYSPIEHLTYSRDRLSNFFAISMSSFEFEGAFRMLQRLGLTYAAVTSPLKMKADEIATEKSPEAVLCQSVNTLSIKQEKIYGHNTDLAGFQALVLELPMNSKVAVWGGGGTLRTIQAILPRAVCYSAQTGQLREGFSDFEGGPDVVIWATGPHGAAPQNGWKPQIVIDLNYRQDSNAKSYAIDQSSRYRSGLMMFREQAEAQQVEWEKHVQFFWPNLSNP